MNQNKTYPSIAQCFGIVGIIILSTIVFSPLTFLHIDWLTKELANFLMYTLGMGLSLAISHKMRKARTGVENYPIQFNEILIFIPLLIATISLQLGVTVPLTSLIPMPDFFKQIFLEMGSQTGLFAFLTIAIAAPLIEEIIFRGVILDGLLNRYEPIKAILISSFFFGIVHLNPWQFITAMLIGSFAGWVYWRTRNLTFTIFIHFANNCFAFIWMSKTNMEEMLDMSAVDLYGGLTMTTLIIGGCILLFLISIYWLDKIMSKNTIDS